MLFIRNLLLLIGLPWLVLVGCSTVSEDILLDLHVESLDSPATNLVAVYKIGVDDVVKVNVWKNPELSVEVPVRPDGMISIPLIGDIKAGGQSPSDVAFDIKQKLAVYVRDPQVTVILTQLNSHEYLSRVRVTGAVNNPVSLAFRQGMTILDAVLAAGGINDFASAGNTKLYCRINNKANSISVDLDDILHDGKLGTNYVFKPGDIITVPERLF